MKRLTLTLMLACASPVLANDLESHLDGCARFSKMVLVIVEARRQHEGLDTAIRGIPDMPEVQKFGFDPSVARQTILHTELLYDSVSPKVVSEWMKLMCVEKAVKQE